MIDHALFDPATIDPDTKRLNAEIIAAHAAQADPWSIPIAAVRERRRQGTKASPAMPRSVRAETVTIDGPGGPLALRMIRPDARKWPKARGAYLHIHRGGWVWGAADEQDPWLERIADTCGFVCLSVEYRLAPEHPYPAALEDCEAAALWLAGPGRAELGITALTIGGESAGAHLAVMTLLRLRDRHGLPRAFRGANLNAGFFDLGLTPSVRNWGDERLVVNTKDLTTFANDYVRDGIDRRRPDVSPLYADLAGLPPALFTVGTHDPLLDDTLYMSSRWAAAGNGGHTAIYPGGCHVFVRYPGALTERALELIDRFLMALA
ncbi:alpha/beta hydrolase [Methylobacterium sp. Leaf469]|uniref:alpha/beta hydrolase n=1 Tax=unclassified Methylobacterium TaxID=2615210 RepID=UPI0006F2AFDD|nr:MULTISPECIES: alpha/beta hydrolase [unclassified Methylobacterium]USU33023.1 alpha/beta hydrolase [Methylobacterium sp. OTU13CASTA1]KQO72633.1 alpha/beta hydrolase [Methylobacterium sp. Leaf87]KQP33454.1 alpha/beta hydrolase [Methylobacterium sp. Leaf100]KQP69835.1 alpha/beta hydrolase [Methylobacterium sp. Leaf112]KQU03516.1 alpha/beta hydrolase [Methylobacterium sp. Leaf469]